MPALTSRLSLHDGATVDVTRHAAAAPIATALLLPALGVPVRMYRGLAEALAAQGVSAAFADPRGHGSSSVRPGRRVNFGYGALVTNRSSLSR
jgi:predicted alpha/beta hydrolase